MATASTEDGVPVEQAGGPPVPESESGEVISMETQLNNVMEMIKNQADEMERIKKDLNDSKKEMEEKHRAKEEEVKEQHEKEIAKQNKEIEELKKRLQDKTESKTFEKDDEKLRPIDMKDIKKPTEYDGKVDEFTAWYERLKDLLINRHQSWEKVIKNIEEKKDVRIINAKDEIFKNLDEKINEQSMVYMQQLQAYLRTYTKSSLFNKVNKTKAEEAPEILRDIIQKGQSYNKNKLVSLKAQIYAPPRANKTEELEKILTEWKHNIDLVEKEDSTFTMNDDTKMTLLIKIAPKEYVKDLRENYFKAEYKDKYHLLEQALFDEILTRKMDDDAIKGNIGAVTSGKAENEKGNSETQTTKKQKYGLKAGAGYRVSRRKEAEKKTTMSLKESNRELMKERRAAKAVKEHEDHEHQARAGSAEAHTCSEIAQKRVKAKDFLSQQHGHHGGRDNSLARRRSNGIRGSRRRAKEKEKAKVTAKAKAKEKVKMEAKAASMTCQTGGAGQ